MNLEAINKWLDEEYGCSYTKLEELHNFYFEKYCDLQQENKKINGSIQTYNILLKANVEENKQLKDNWNKLKEYAKEIISTDNELYGTDLLDKMQELEQGSDSNVKD
jgi:hypothetical protein